MSASKRQIILSGKTRWQVELGRVNGKRVRPVFKTEAEAERAIERHEKDQKRLGDLWLRLTPQERNTIITIYDEARLAGHSLREVWDGFRTWKAEQGAKPVVATVPFREAVEELKRRKLKVGNDERYVEEMCGLVMKLAKGQEERPISEFTADDLEKWIDDQPWGKSTRKSNMGRFSSLWKLAVDKGWVSHNIVDRLEPVGKISVTPEIFPNERCLRLMACALANDAHQRAVAPLALGLFCGMRPEEASHKKFGWHFIDLKRGLIRVEGEIAKDGDRRVVHMLPTAKAWLRLAADLKNPLPPVNERRLVDSICELAKIGHWPKDVLRKTAATHLYHHYGDAGRVVMELGNSIRILLKHYIGLVDKQTSRAFWTITPEKASADLKKLTGAATLPTHSANETATAAG